MPSSSSSSSSSLLKEQQEEQRDDEEDTTTSRMAIGPSRLPTLPCLVKNIVEDAIEVLILNDRCGNNNNGNNNNENRSPNAKGNENSSASPEDVDVDLKPPPPPAAAAVAVAVAFPSSLHDAAAAADAATGKEEEEEEETTRRKRNNNNNNNNRRNSNSNSRKGGVSVRSVVRFGHVEFRSYNLTVGDHPFCRDSCPLTMGWDHTTTTIVHQDYFPTPSMQTRNTSGSSRNSTGKRRGRPRRLSLKERRERIVLVNGLDGIQSVLQMEIERRKEYLHQLICDDAARRPETKWMTSIFDSDKKDDDSDEECGSRIIDEQLVKLDEIVAAAASRKKYLHQFLRDDAVRRPETKWMTSLLDIEDDVDNETNNNNNEDGLVVVNRIIDNEPPCLVGIDKIVPLSTAAGYRPSLAAVVSATTSVDEVVVTTAGAAAAAAAASYRTTNNNASSLPAVKKRAIPTCTPCQQRTTNVFSSPSWNTTSCPYVLQASSA